ncbi:MAG: hypothetical protein KDB00_29175, partial [Planctomycetales bacterium]|nr:hypothetical protein [Planctomycetales bacterium]
RSGSRQDFRQFLVPIETLDEFRYPKKRIGTRHHYSIYFYLKRFADKVQQPLVSSLQANPCRCVAATMGG